MPIPNFQAFMKPFLQTLNDGKEHSIGESYRNVTNHMKLTEHDRAQMLPSGKVSIVKNRFSWARTYLKKAGLVDITRRGYSKITPQGLQLLNQNPASIDITVLKCYPSFCDFLTNSPHTKNTNGTMNTNTDEKTPEEQMETAFEKLSLGVGEELLDIIKANSPDFFEKLVIDLILAMGYGGSRKEAGEALGGRGDEGVDGVIHEDRLGLDRIYIQAKRWSGCVGRPEVQKFAGALQGQRARKGIMITTSYFSNDANEYVEKIDNRISLIDGLQLVQLMMEHNVGVQSKQIFEIKRIDNDYFEE